MIRKKVDTPNDGIVKIYSCENNSSSGSMPVETLTFKNTLRYKERTVGFNRYYTALNNSIRVAYVLRCPMLRKVMAQDIAIPNDGKYYRIVQIQYPENLTPPMMDLTLEEVVGNYEFE